MQRLRHAMRGVAALARARWFAMQAGRFAMFSARFLVSGRRFLMQAERYAMFLARFLMRAMRFVMLAVAYAMSANSPILVPSWKIVRLGACCGIRGDAGCLDPPAWRESENH